MLKTMPQHKQTGPVPFPDPRVEAGRSVLARFGYAHQDGPFPREDYDEMWTLLKGDFPSPNGSPVPDYGAMTEAQRDAARAYMDARLVADRRYELCSVSQREIFEQGIDTELVERYTTIRDAYEDAVEDFGAARARLQEMF